MSVIAQALAEISTKVPVYCDKRGHLYVCQHNKMFVRVDREGTVYQPPLCCVGWMHVETYEVEYYDD